MSAKMTKQLGRCPVGHGCDVMPCPACFMASQGGAAFPNARVWQHGMSLRDYIATRVYVKLIGPGRERAYESLASEALKAADAMLKVREADNGVPRAANAVGLDRVADRMGSSSPPVGERRPGDTWNGDYD